MEKLTVTSLCAGLEGFPRCVDLLDRCPEIAILAQPGGLNEAGAWSVLERSDILLLDEVAILQEGSEAIRGLHTNHPLIGRNNYNKNNILPALSLGISGVITRQSLPDSSVERSQLSIPGRGYRGDWLGHSRMN